MPLSSPHNHLPQIRPTANEQMPLHEKLILVFKDKVKEAKTEQDRERAERDLAKLQESASVE